MSSEPEVTVTAGRLSDGREIFYFDEGVAPLRPRDSRRLAPVTATPELRLDAMAGEWVTIAGHRQDRTHLPPDDECPLCPSRSGRATEIPGSDYGVVVFENRFPSFVPPNGVDAVTPAEDDAGRPSAGVGRCEVICFTPDHAASFSSLSPTRVRTIVAAWIHRTLALSQLAYVEQVFCFENRGREIGVTLGHPHGQIYGYPFVTPRTARELERERRHRELTGRSLWGDLVQAELEHGDRLVLRGDHWSVFVPFAARWPVHLYLVPHRHVADLTELDEQELAELPHVYLEILRRLEHAYGADVPYVAAWHQAPVRRERELGHCRLELFSIRRAPGKLKYLAGSESAMGAFINDLSPESVAAALRESA